MLISNPFRHKYALGIRPRSVLHSSILHRAKTDASRTGFDTRINERVNRSLGRIDRLHVALSRHRLTRFMATDSRSVALWRGGSPSNLSNGDQ